MTNEIERTLRSRIVLIVAVSVFVLIGSSKFTGTGSGLARAADLLLGYGFPEDSIAQFPIVGSTYESLNGTTYPTAPIPIELLSLELRGPGNLAETVPLPPLSNSAQIDSFFDIFVELSVGGQPPKPIDSFFDIFYRIDNNDPPIAGRQTFDTEMLQMVLTGQYPGPTGPIPIAIRDSPTQASTGQHSLTELPNGRFLVNSFFNVFTEISLDAGASWHQSAGPIHLELTNVLPEPTSGLMAICGLIGLGIAARRSQ